MRNKSISNVLIAFIIAILIVVISFLLGYGRDTIGLIGLITFLGFWIILNQRYPIKEKK